MGGLSGDPSLPECGFEVVEAADPTADPCLYGTTIAGPERFERSPGPPVAETLPFNSPAEGNICVHVINGDGTRGSRVSSASIALDGVELIDPSHFNPGIEVIEVRRTVPTGAHVVSVELRSGAGRSLTVEVRHVGSTVSPHNPIVGANGILRAFDLHAAPAIFSPNGNGIRDTTSLGAVVDFISPVPGNAGMATYEIAARFEIAGGVSCLPTRTLETVVPIAEPQTTAVSTTWDGTDAGGVVVADGVYYYRAIIETLQVTPSGTRTLLDSVVAQVQTVRVTSDDDPPVLIIRSPITSPGATHEDHFPVAGFARDYGAGLASLTIADEIAAAPLPVIGDTFTYDAPLPPQGDDLVVSRTFVLTASDLAENTTVRTVRVDRAPHAVPRQRLLYAAPGTPPDEITSLVASTGGETIAYLRRSNIHLIQYPAESAAATAVPALLASGRVARVELNRLDVADVVEPRDPWFDCCGTLNQEALTIIDADIAWGTTTGSRTVTIGIVDSGIDHQHPELSPNLFLNEWELPTSDEFLGDERIVDTNGDGVITMDDLNHPDNLGKVPGAPDIVTTMDLIDGDPQTDIGLEGDLNGDGCPGRCGVDDDLDGFADLDDRDVRSADYDGDGTRISGDDGVFGNADDDLDDYALSAKDDDENGVADDIVGPDFGCDPDEPTMETDGRVSCVRLSPDNDPMDRNGHGTAVAGIIGAIEDFGVVFPGDVGIVGVNWEVRLAMVRAGVGDTKFLSGGATQRAADYLADLAARPGVNMKAVNFSFGSRLGSEDDPFGPLGRDSRATSLDAVGVLVVAAAGNDGVDLDAEVDSNGDPVTVNLPSSATNGNIIAIAASSDDGSLADFSNRGRTQVDLSAPGDNDFLDPVVLTTYVLDDCLWVFWRDLPFTLAAADCADGYAEFSGTSAAAPYVAGTIGLMQAVNPNLSHATLKRLLLATVDTEDNLNVLTRGLLDSLGAVHAAELEPAPPDLPGINTDADPAVSGDGRVVAFVSNRVTAANPFGRTRIWLVAADGTGLREIEAPADAVEAEPSLNHDGMVLAFSSDRNSPGEPDIFAAEISPLDFSVLNLVQRTDNEVTDRQPRVSADGRFIVFASAFDATGDPLDDFEVFRITVNDDPATGLVLNQELHEHRTQLSFNPPSGTSVFSHDHRPVVSADGRVVVWITAVGNRIPFFGTHDALNVAEFSTDDGFALTTHFNPLNAKKAPVALAGDPIQIHFGPTFPTDIEFFIVDLNGDVVTSFEAISTGAAVSSDGAKIATFIPIIGGGLLLTDRNTGEQLQLAFEPTFEPFTSPDLIVTSCDLGAQIALAASLDRSHPLCKVSMSDDGSTVVFVGTQLNRLGSFGARPGDIYVFREGVGTIRLTPN